MTSNGGKDSKETTFCPWCQRSSVVVYVHGHGQCSLCKTNIEPCCQGTPSSDIIKRH